MIRPFSEPARITCAFLLAPLLYTVFCTLLDIRSIASPTYLGSLGITTFFAYLFAIPPLLIALLVFRKIGKESIKNYTIAGALVGGMMCLGMSSSYDGNPAEPLLALMFGAILAGSISFLFALIRGAKWMNSDTHA